ncbi:hypothetical protein C8N35_11734 [Breoghania corrubedonensis]|uniref:Uncharacterized protein n=1 Tax=Breoghania corrubedonensis TaxID=665038 RepID=A0A2T5UNX9_9HYPH|nr:hypothetical protein [Breoghania corrubedonensis]PTW53218.1 hypothetical protein C8N35_11734 [Breoghania corrubedonensis]
MRAFDDQLGVAVIVGLLMGMGTGLPAETYDEARQDAYRIVPRLDRLESDIRQGYRDARRGVEKVQETISLSQQGYRQVLRGLGG